MGDLRINQAELARKTQIRPATINEYYHELVERVNLDYISRICAALDCEVGDILEYVPDVNPTKQLKSRKNEQK